MAKINQPRVQVPVGGWGTAKKPQLAFNPKQSKAKQQAAMSQSISWDGPAFVPTAPREDLFTLVTYNVNNMFDDIDADPTKGTAAKPAVMMKAAGKVAHRSGADLMTNQEVENLQIYRKWGQEFAGNRLPNAVLEPGNDKRGINVAAMSRYPISKVVTHKDVEFPLADGSAMTKFSRDLLRVDVEVGQETLSVYTTHSRNRRWGAPEEVALGDNQRIGEARAIKRIVADEMKAYPGRLYMITGDFNDGTEDKSLQEILHGPGDKMIDTLEGVPANQRNTWPANPAKLGKFKATQFDHILIPESMRHRLVDSEVLDMHELTANASDHKPLRARFTITP
jgi:endonuclease/exonuclease/phosphatase family metal-dependent hydrolase